MLISYHWLKKFVNLKQTPQQVADKITLNLVEVESLAKRGDDTILEIENKGITNRPDCFCQLGFAREVAAYFNLEFKNLLSKLKDLKFAQSKNIPFSVEILEPTLCYRYSSIVLTDIKVKPSPKWLRVGLENCGIRSINNVVDSTNYVMLELGQPMHAFDYDKLEGQKIIVRKANKNESIKTLDGSIRKLNPQILVIADKINPVGIAGIIGGAKSEITNNTKTIVLESANFNNINNRQSEKYLKLRTEASTRFEKGLDVNLALSALNRTIELLQKLADAKIASKTIDLQYKRINPWKITTKLDWLNKFLGLNLSSQEIIKILKRLQLTSKLANGKLIVNIPTYRSDLKMPADIAEEIARIYGYDNIPFSPLSGPIEPPKANQTIVLNKKTKIFLQGMGLTEIITSPFLSKNILEIFSFDPEKHLKLINPLTIDQEYLRQSLIPNLVTAAKNNLRFFNQLNLFEINRIFIPKGNNQPEEIINLAILLVKRNSFLYLKGYLESLMEFLGININVVSLKVDSSFWDKDNTAEIIFKDNQSLGKIGKIKKEAQRQFDINQDLSILEINFSKIVKLANLTKIYKPIPNYPPVIEDLTFIIEPRTYVQDLIQLIKSCSSIIQSVELINSYKNNRTFRITYQGAKQSLSSLKVAKIRKEIILKVTKKGLGTLRGKVMD